LERPRATVVATDVSTDALAIARDNARRLGAEVEFVESDLLAATSGEFDVIVSNPPYISAADWAGLQREVREYEPYPALLAGETGTEVYARLILEAHPRLRPGGWLVLELGFDSATAVRALVSGGWTQIETRRDLRDWERVLVARHR
jgi:release factor glutamine methyltransferase